MRPAHRLLHRHRRLFVCHEQCDAPCCAVVVLALFRAWIAISIMISVNMNIEVPLLITPVLFSDAGRFDISESIVISFAPDSTKIALTRWFLPLSRVSASDTAVSPLVLARFPCEAQHCRIHLECGV